MIKPPKMNERHIQYILSRKHAFTKCFPNVYIDCRSSMEIDLLFISESGYPYFYEIKCSRADFKNDVYKRKHERLQQRDKSFPFKPKHFIYVCHGFEVAAEDVPEYAGLYVVTSNGGLLVKKKPPIMWKEVVTKDQLFKLYEKFYYRFKNKWQKESFQIMREYRLKRNGGINL